MHTEIAIKQLPVPVCATPRREAQAGDSPCTGTATECQALLLARRAQNCPSPAGLWHQVSLHGAGVREPLHSSPRCSHPGFDPGNREGDKEWDPYLGWRVSLAWSRARPCAPGVFGVSLAGSHTPVPSAGARP